MSSPKRTKVQREKDLTLIARLYLEGLAQWQIVDKINSERKYNLTQQMISYDLIDIRKKWLESSLRNFDEAKAQELSKIDNLEATYWEGYHKKEDARFLDGVLKCVTKRCEILGTDAPKKLDVDMENPIHVYLPDNKRGNDDS